jgi:hypothetical protein
MNDMNSLETQLRSWAPRAPSAKVKRRLFGHHFSQTAAGALTTLLQAGAGTAPSLALPDQDEAHFPTIRLRWLAPVSAALVISIAFLGERTRAVPSAASASPMVAVALSNQSAAAWLPSSFACAQNGLPAETFEWTNGSGSTSSIRSLSGPNGTND